MKSERERQRERERDRERQRERERVLSCIWVIWKCPARDGI